MDHKEPTVTQGVPLPNVARLMGAPYTAVYNLALRGLLGDLLRVGGRWYVRQRVLANLAVNGFSAESGEVLAAYHRHGAYLEQAARHLATRRMSGLDCADLEAHTRWLASVRAGLVGQLEADRAEAEANRDRGTAAVLSLILALLPTATYSPAEGGRWNAHFKIPGAIDIALPSEDAPDPAAPSTETPATSEDHHVHD